MPFLSTSRDRNDRALNKGFFFYYFLLFFFNFQHEHRIIDYGFTSLY